MKLTSTPSSPTTIARDVGGLSFRLDADGLTIGTPGGPEDLRYNVGEALALLTFLRSPGVARLLGRLWLAELHAAELGHVDDDNQHKRFAGRKAA